MADVVISADHLSKRYRIAGPQPHYHTLRDSLVNAVTGFRRRPPAQHVWALDDVSFELEQGEVLGIVGRNGAGKSTLLKVLARITEPTRGQAMLRGRVGSLLEVATGFHPELSGRENIYLNGAVLGMKKAEIDSLFDEIVAFAGIEKFIDTPVKRYSSGMYLRLAFSVAAHLQPEILMLDEIFAVGDIEFTRKCLGRMEEVTREGRTVLLVSHNLSTIKSRCTKALLLESGRVKAFGRVDEVVSEYLSGGSHAAEQIIEDRAHDYWGSDIRLRRVKLLGGVMNNFACYWRQPIRVELEIEVVRAVDDVCLGAGIRMLDDTFLSIVHHDDDGRERWTFEPGRYVVSYQLENNLAPGLYKLHFGAYQGRSGQRNLCSIDPTIIEVLEVAEDGATPNPANTGLVNTQSTWRVPERLA